MQVIFKGAVILAVGLLATSGAIRLTAQQLDPALLGDIRFRSIGPAVMSGRVSCLDVVSADGKTIYVGAASGGIWKSQDLGITFKPVF
ncbi:MAG: hypothetical protein RMK52_10235, partial [Chitinophagales bacterium]|nr:hypothetical protein [Chitinophagales bacterium]